VVSLLIRYPETGMTETPLAERAADLMVCQVPLVSPDATPAAAINLMAEHGIPELPVVDVDGLLLGAVRLDDLRRSSDRTVQQAMTAVAASVSPDCTSFEAISLMLQSGKDHLPVTESGRFVGLITRRNVVRRFEDG
jgi:CBS domain-containing protein